MAKKITITFMGIIFLVIFGINRYITFEAESVASNLCTLIKNPIEENFLKLPKIGQAANHKLNYIIKNYPDHSSCMVKSSKFNMSPFETSILISNGKIELLGLRFGYVFKLDKQSKLYFKFTPSFLGYWSPSTNG